MKIFSYELNSKAILGLQTGGKNYCLTGLLRAYYFQSGKILPGEIDLVSLLGAELLDLKVLAAAVKWAGDKKILGRYLLKDNLKFLLPIKPGKIIALGRNFAEHAKEQGAPVPAEPIIFEKANSSVIGPGQPVRYPFFMKKEYGKEARVDHEVELAIVIGKTASKVKARAAMEYVFGYTILNDMTARNIQAQDFKKNQPWFRSKSIDTFCPLGPWIVTKDEVRNANNLKLELRVNGVVKQKDSTGTFIFKIPEMLEYITKYLTLFPGDIISTGTPDGIRPVNPGDIMEAEIEGIGILRNRIVKERL